MANITIDGKEYDLESLTDSARAQLGSMRIADQEVASLQAKMALAQTARNAYAGGLAQNLPKKEAAANKKKDVVTIDGKKYKQEDFSEDAKKQIGMLRLTDKKLNALQAELAMANMARVAYGQALKTELDA